MDEHIEEAVEFRAIKGKRYLENILKRKDYNIPIVDITSLESHVPA